MLKSYLYESVQLDEEVEDKPKNCCEKFKDYIYDRWRTFTHPEYRILKIFREEERENRPFTIL